LIIYSSFKF